MTIGRQRNIGTKCKRFKARIFYVFFLSILFIATSKSQNTIKIPQNYSSIQAAINAASNGDTLEISGTITEANIKVNKNIILKGKGKNSTIIQADTSPLSSKNRVMTIDTGITVEIRDMTIQNGRIHYSNQTYVYGAGILNYGLLTVKNCLFRNNRLESYFNYGGAIANRGGSLKVDACEFSNNCSNKFYNDYYGTAIFSESDDYQTILLNSTFHDLNIKLTNISLRLGIICLYSSFQIENCDFYNNNIEFPSGVFGGAFVLSVPWAGILKDSINKITSCRIFNNNFINCGVTLFGCHSFNSKLEIDNIKIFDNSSSINFYSKAGYSYTSIFDILGFNLNLKNLYINDNEFEVLNIIPYLIRLYAYEGIIRNVCVVNNKLTHTNFDNNDYFGWFMSIGASNTITKVNIIAEEITFCGNSLIANNKIKSFGFIETRAYKEFGNSIIIRNSTFSKNYFKSSIVQNLGMLFNFNDGLTYLINCTISDNIFETAQNFAGGVIFNYFKLFLNNVTCYNNIVKNNVKTTGFVYQLSGELKIRNSIIYNNGMTEFYAKSGLIKSEGYNIFRNKDNLSTIHSTDMINIDPRLDSLKNNGGLTPTHSLLFNSPVINAAAKTGLFNDTIQIDQRYFDRDDINDIGAFEYHKPYFKNIKTSQRQRSICPES